MLTELRIENLLLIERVHLELAAGLNAFTGETGAGKSLLVDALGLLFGARGEPDLVRPGAEAAEVTACFLLSDPELAASLQEECGVVFDGLNGTGASAERTTGRARPRRALPAAELIVSRILPRNGRARAYANGRPIALPALKTLGASLLDLHGQHENQSLLRPATRLEILDRFAEAQDARAACRRAWQAARTEAEGLTELRRAARERQAREELVRFQLQELEAARLDELDPEALENELKLLRGAQAIREATQAAALHLDGEEGASAAALLARALRGLETLGDAPAETGTLTERLAGLLSEVRELARDLEALAGKAKSNPERLAQVEESRARWRGLERKYARDLPALRAWYEELRTQRAGLENLDERTAAAEANLQRAVTELKSAAARLTRLRRAAAKELERRAQAELADLSLGGAVLKVELVSSRPAATARAAAGASPGDADEASRLLPPGLGPAGAEGLELLFTANPELPLKPLAECASGGELSRVMLALKGVLAQAGGADRLPVVVFDEVDSGVGGRLGAVLGRKLAGLARVRQVLSVTHLPQVAAYAQRQIQVEKQRQGNGAVISARPLDGAGRIEELAQMLRGEAATARTRAEAGEMLRAAQAEMAGKRG